MKKANQDNSEDNDKKTPENALIRLQQSLQQDRQGRRVEGQKPVRPDPRPRINPHDYQPLEAPDHTFCRLCGNSWTHYVRNLTSERKRQQKDQSQPSQICKHCYAKAKRRAQQSATILPGTCDPARMERLTAPYSRCTICELDPAVYLDRSTGTTLCETCYQRISSSPEHGQVSG